MNNERKTAPWPFQLSMPNTLNNPCAQRCKTIVEHDRAEAQVALAEATFDSADRTYRNKKVGGPNLLLDAITALSKAKVRLYNAKIDLMWYGGPYAGSTTKAKG